MQAVVIAGGLGTRLRPLTFNRPKALVPLLNKPQILHILERLPSSVDEVFVAVNYMYDRVREFFQEADAGRSVEVVEEATPLGTGGAVKNVASRIGGTFAVYNRDVIYYLDLSRLLAFHRKRGALATIALHEVPDPSAFGVVAMDGSRVTRFVEKPAPGEAPSRLVNAGRNILEPEVLDGLAAGREVSMEREVFPALASKGLHGFPFEGYWGDAGTLEGYLAATGMLLANGGGRRGPRAEEGGGRPRWGGRVPRGGAGSRRRRPGAVLG